MDVSHPVCKCGVWSGARPRDLGVSEVGVLKSPGRCLNALEGNRIERTGAHPRRQRRAAERSLESRGRVSKRWLNLEPKLSVEISEALSSRSVHLSFVLLM